MPVTRATTQPASAAVSFLNSSATPQVAVCVCECAVGPFQLLLMLVSFCRLLVKCTWDKTSTGFPFPFTKYHCSPALCLFSHPNGNFGLLFLFLLVSSWPGFRQVGVNNVSRAFLSLSELQKHYCFQMHEHICPDAPQNLSLALVSFARRTSSSWDEMWLQKLSHINADVMGEKVGCQSYIF